MQQKKSLCKSPKLSENFTFYDKSEKFPKHDIYERIINGFEICSRCVHSHLSKCKEDVAFYFMVTPHDIEFTLYLKMFSKHVTKINAKITFERT